MAVETGDMAADAGGVAPEGAGGDVARAAPVAAVVKTRKSELRRKTW